MGQKFGGAKRKEGRATFSRQRARMRPNSVGHCRLQIGALRVYYDVLESPERVVVVKAVGIKLRDRVFIGREELKL